MYRSSLSLSLCLPDHSVLSLSSSFLSLSLSLSFFLSLSRFFSNVSLSRSRRHTFYFTQYAVAHHATPRQATPSHATPRHAVSGNNIVLAGSNGGNVWPTLRAKGYANSEDARGEQAEPLCHAVFTERLFFFLLLLHLLHFFLVRRGCLPRREITASDNYDVCTHRGRFVFHDCGRGCDSMSSATLTDIPRCFFFRLTSNPVLPNRDGTRVAFHIFFPSIVPSSYRWKPSNDVWSLSLDRTSQWSSFVC